MASFDARLRLLGRPGLPLGVEVDLTGDRLRVSTGENPLANWSLDEVHIARFSDGFHIRAEEEVVVLSVDDPLGFAIELGMIER